MRASRVLLSAVSVSLIASGLTTTVVSAPASAVAPRTQIPAISAKSADVTSRPDLASAQLAARLVGHRVEVTGLETETSTTWVNPNGTLTQTQNAVPVRAKVAGAWKPIDTNLQQTPNGLGPKVSTADVTFSAGGDGQLSRLRASGGVVTVGWNGSLPTPQIAGDTATYKNVQPGVDLVMTAGAAGYEMSIVLTKRPDSAPTFNLPVETSGLSVAQAADGHLTYNNAAGKQVGVSGAGVMWGAATSSHALHGKAAAIASHLAKNGGISVLSFSPAASFLNDPSVSYPVTIDPPTSITQDGYTYINSAAPTSSYYNNLISADGVSGITQAGQDTSSSTGQSTAFYQFDASQLKGTAVQSASLSVDEVGSSSCTPTELDVYDATAISSSTTYNAAPTLGANWASQDGGKGYSSSCPAGAVAFDVTNLVKNVWATDSNSNETVGLVANDPTSSQMMTFAGSDASVSITYTSAPGALTGLSTLPCLHDCGASNTLVWTNSTTPEFAATSVDPNDSLLATTFQVWAGTSANPTTMVTSGAVSNVTSGKGATWTVPSANLSDGSSYEWRAQACNPTMCSLWSNWTQFSVDTTAPAAPSISSTTLSGYTTTTSGSFSWTDSASDLDSYGCFFDGNPCVAAHLSGTTYTVSGLSNGQHKLEIDAYDLAGNMTPATYTFVEGNALLSSPLDQARTEQYITLNGSGPAGQGYVDYFYQVGDNGGFSLIPLTDLNVGGGESWPLQLSAHTSGVVWNARFTVAENGLVQVYACFYSDTARDNQACSPANNVQLTASAFAGTDATKQVGPGTLALLTGDYAVNATDVNVPSYTGSLSVSRTFATLNPVTASGAAGVFGPGWRASFDGPQAGHAGAVLVDNSTSGYLTLADSDGTQELYTYNSAAGDYVGQNDNAGDGSSINGDSTDGFTLVDADGTQTVFAQAGGQWVASQVIETSSTPAATTTVFSYDSSGRVTQIVAPAPAGVDCSTSPTTTPGCRSLQFTYATTTTATTSVFGDYAGQLSGVAFTSYDPTASAMSSVQVAAYAYDTSGYLRQAWDPRISPNLITAYSYDSNGRIATTTPPGLATTTFTYDSAGRLSTVSHPDPSGPTATTTIAYNVPVDSTGPINLTSSVTAAWGQTDAPVTATALFDPDHVPSGAPTSTDWPYASLTYMDVNGRTVNTAMYGNNAWQTDVTQYDQYGNSVWSITAANLDEAITPTSATDPAVAAMTSELARANALADVSTYSADGTELVSTLGPTHQVLLSSGVLIDGRAHTATTYDEGAPSGGPYRLPTTTTHSVQPVNASTDYDTTTTHTGYDALVSGDTSGWLLHQATSQTSVMSGSNLVAYTRYNAASQVIEARLPMATTDSSGVGNDAHTTVTTYYTPTGTGGCVSAALAGLLCSTGPAAQPTTGKPLPVTTTTYSIYDEPLVVSETTGSAVRTTTTGYDAAGRETSSSVTVTPSGGDGTTTPSQSFSYDTATGLPTTTTDATSASVSNSYDSLGRVHVYTDATGAQTTTAYDVDGRISSVIDPKGTTSYTYDGVSGEHRGVVTSLTDSVTGTFSGTYSNDAQLASQTYPGGLTATYSYDNTGAAVDTAYSKSGVSWLDFNVTRDGASRIVGANNAAGNASTYAYDNASRLTTAVDNVQGMCTQRSYGYNADSDRTSLATSSFRTTNGVCSGSGTPTTVTHTYDAADRITDSGYTYDDFGRTLSVPSADAGGNGMVTLGYYTNDLVQQVAGTSAGSAPKAYGLDPTDRVLTETSGGNGGAPGAGLTVEATVSADDTSGSNNFSTPALSTTTPGDLLVALVSVDGPTGSSQSTKVSGAGLTWTLAKNAHNQRGSAEIWTARATGQVINSQISVGKTLSGGDGSVTVLAIAGAAGVGASNVASASTGAPSLNLTTTAANSLVLVAGQDPTGADTHTPNSGQTVIHEYADTTHPDDFWQQRVAGTAGAAGTHLTIGDSAPTGDAWDLAAVEITPGVPAAAPTLLAPQTQVIQDALAQTSATGLQHKSVTISTRQQGDLLVAYVSFAGAVGQTATVSGGGLTWSLLSRANTQAGTSEVWTATAAGVLSSASISVDLAKTASAGQFDVIAYTGAAGIGQHAEASGGGSLPSVSLNNLTAGSIVLGVGNDSANGTTHTPTAGFIVNEKSDTTNHADYWIQNQGTTTATSGSSVTIGDSAPSSETWNMAAVEILPIAGQGSPGVASGLGSTTSSSFTPPAGSLLVAVGTSDSSGFSAYAVSDSQGLTWRQLVAQAPSGQGPEAIWVADAPTTPTGMTVSLTATGNSSALIGLQVLVYTGAAPAASQTGATATASDTGTNGAINVTDTNANSAVVGGLDQWGSSAPSWTLTGTTQVSNPTFSSDNHLYNFDATYPPGTLNASSIGYKITSNSTGTVYNLIAAEILPTSGAVATLTDRYDGGGDSPAWSSGSDGSWTRNVTGLDGNDDAVVGYNPTTAVTTTTLQVMDLRGDVAATADPSGSGVTATYTYDEFGNATSTDPNRYGWLGGKEREQADMGGLMLMGQRLYDPATGRFLQVDPIPGGSANNYDYVGQDPVNDLDLAGTTNAGDGAGSGGPADFGNEDPSDFRQPLFDGHLLDEGEGHGMPHVDESQSKSKPEAKSEPAKPKSSIGTFMQNMGKAKISEVHVEPATSATKANRGGYSINVVYKYAGRQYNYHLIVSRSNVVTHTTVKPFVGPLRR